MDSKIVFVYETPDSNKMILTIDLNHYANPSEIVSTIENAARIHFCFPKFDPNLSYRTTAKNVALIITLIIVIFGGGSVLYDRFFNR